MNLSTIVYLSIGGSLGTLCRAGVYFLVPQSSFPWATAIVNSVGCFFIGVIFSLIGHDSGHPFRWLMLVGFLGAFTTFSTYGLDIVRLMQNKAYIQGIAYFVLNNGAGIVAVLLGLYVGRALILWN